MAILMGTMMINHEDLLINHMNHINIAIFGVDIMNHIIIGTI